LQNTRFGAGAQSYSGVRRPEKRDTRSAQRNNLRGMGKLSPTQLYCPSLIVQLQSCRMLTGEEVRNLLGPFSIRLDDDQLRHLLTYLGLLMKWNQAINLTAIRDERECITRHFGESLYLATVAELRGSLLDVGSGAGFPGLALKLVLPELRVTLLEPVAKKRAFLKEVARACAMSYVEILADRLENLSLTSKVDAATIRAVGNIPSWVGHLTRHLNPLGRIYVWTTDLKASDNLSLSDRVGWISKMPIPVSRHREIWVGVPK
jgi:16S rRNA (guanine527-N7)-methyltransferase